MKDGGPVWFENQEAFEDYVRYKVAEIIRDLTIQPYNWKVKSCSPDGGALL